MACFDHRWMKTRMASTLSTSSSRLNHLVERFNGGPRGGATMSGTALTPRATAPATMATASAYTAPPCYKPYPYSIPSPYASPSHFGNPYHYGKISNATGSTAGNSLAPNIPRVLPTLMVTASSSPATRPVSAPSNSALYIRSVFSPNSALGAEGLYSARRRIRFLISEYTNRNFPRQ